jgi:hypothetical protein
MIHTSQKAKIELLLERLFDSQREEWKAELSPDEFERRRHDFVFHMTDWNGDLEGLAELFKNPDDLDEEAASSFLIGFLYHVLPHLNAAGRLLLGRISDPFADQEG